MKKIVSVGGGPAGLYFAILARKADPSLEITVLERNRPDDTFGWGVVFSDATLGNLDEADAESMAEVRRSFVHWDDIHVFFRGQKVVSTGHGFCGLSRLRLLNILQDRARAVGVKVEFERDVQDVKKEIDADLVLVADGVNSRIREQFKDQFKPTIDWRKCKFSWLGADMKLPAFTFIFRENEHGLFQVHSYPFDDQRSTFIVECREETWRKAGLEGATDEQTIAYMEKLFAEDLKGHRLLGNRSIWRTFPTIRNQHWFHDNMVIMGDAAHTAHFSIGSGTKLAMEDAIALRDSMVLKKGEGVRAVLEHYEQSRKPEVERIQRAAQTSLEWFENSHRYMKMDPRQLTFSLMTRSKRITYDNLATRDARLVADSTRWFASANTHHGTTSYPDGKPYVPVFTPYRMRGLTLTNRLVVSPMCQYSAENGTPNDWHLVHLGSRAVGGVGLVIAEATGVSPEGRITPGCTGMYAPEHVGAWKRIVDFARLHAPATRMGIQLGHAGRKASTSVPWKGAQPLTSETGAWQTLAPSAVAYKDGWHVPREMDRADMDKVIADFTRATRMSLEAGFDFIELHAAHGYLLNEFLSPLTNRRTDAYGGDVRGRLRFPVEVLDAVRSTWPADKPLGVRISATDWADGGLSEDDRLEIARTLHAHGMDILDVSSGGNVSWQDPVYGRMFNVGFADHVRNETGIPVMTVGNVQDADQANTIIAAGRADLVVMARAHLTDPYITMHAAAKYEHEAFPWPVQYRAVRPAVRKG